MPAVSMLKPSRCLLASLLFLVVFIGPGVCCCWPDGLEREPRASRCTYRDCVHGCNLPHAGLAQDQLKDVLPGRKWIVLIGRNVCRARGGLAVTGHALPAPA